MRQQLEQRRATMTRRGSVVEGAGFAYGEAGIVADFQQELAAHKEIQRHQQLRRETLASWTDSKAIKERMERVAQDEGESRLHHHKLQPTVNAG